MEQRATVLAMGVDMGDEQQAQQNSPTRPTSSDFSVGAPVHVSVQIAVPGRIPLGPGDSAGGGGGKGSSHLPVWVVSADGSSLNDAVQQLQQKLAEKLFFGHLRVVVVSEAFARHGLDNLTDYIRRNPEIRRTAWLGVSAEPAERIMETAPPLQRVPALYLLSMLDQAMQLGKMPRDFLGIFESKLSMRGREPVLPYGNSEGVDNVRVSGLAYFKGDKMVGCTSTRDIASYMELSGEPKGGYSMLIRVPGSNHVVMWQAYRRKRRIKVDIRNGVPHFTVIVHMDGDITEKSSHDVRLNSPQIIESINHEVASAVKQNMQSLLEQTQQQGSDIIGFGEYVRAKQPRYWNQFIGTKGKWEDMYAKTQIDIKVDVRTHRIGMSSA